MAERLAYLEAVVGADITQFRRGMADVRNEVGILSETMGGLGAIGRTMTFAFTAPVVTLGTYAVQAAAEFEEAMRNVNSIAHLSEDEFAALSEAVLDFGSNTRAGATEAAGALYTTFSAGITDTTVAMEFMEIASMTAEAGLADLTTTTEALIGSFLAFNQDALPVEQQLISIRNQADALTQMVQIGVGTMDEFASAIGQVNPTAVSLGVGIEELYGSMAYLTQRGLSAARASVSLNAAFTALLRPSEAMQAAFRQLGVQTGDELIQQFGSFEAALAALAGTTDGSATSMRALFREVRAARAVDLLVSDLEGWNTALNDFNQGLDGATERAREQQMMSFAAHWDLMTSALNAAGITIGNVLMPALIPLVDAVTNFLHLLIDTNPELLTLGVAALSAAAAIGPLLWVVSSIANPIGALVIGVSALAAAFAIDFGSIREVVASTVASILGDMDNWNKAFDIFMSELFPDDIAGTILPDQPEKINTSEFITVEAGDSAWQIWFDNFRDEYADFQDFLDATDLRGVVIHPDDVIEVPTSGAGGSNPLAGFMDRITGLVGQTPEELKKRIMANKVQMQMDDIIGVVFSGAGDTFVDNFQDAFAAVEDLLGIQIGVLLDNVRGFFDQQVGAGINWFASLFEGGGGTDGDTPVYRAVAALLDGNIAAAIDAIIPNLGSDVQTAIEGWGTWIEDAFPTISSSLGRLFNSFSTWVLDEGIPTVSRSMGAIGGAIAAGLYDAIGAAMNFFSSGQASSTADAVGGYLQDGVATPFAEGFQDAIAGSNLAESGLPALQTALDSLANIFDVLEFDQWGEGFTDLATGIGNFVDSIAGADFTGLGILSGGLLIFVNDIGSAMLSAIGDGLTLAGQGIATIIDAVSKAASGDISWMNDMSTGLVQLGLALLQLPIGLINGVINLLETASGLELPDLQTMLDNWSRDLNAWMNAPAGVSSFEIGQIFGTGDDAVFAYNVQLDPQLTNTANLPDELARQFEDFMATAELSADQWSIAITAPPDIDLSGTGFNTFEEYLAAYQSGLTDVEIPLDGVTFTFTPNTSTSVDGAAIGAGTGGTGAPHFDIPNVALTPQNVTVDPTNAVTTVAAGTEGGAAINEAVLPTGSMEDHFAQEIDTAASAAAVQLGNTFMAGGVVDPQIIVTNFLTPLETAWNTTFGPEGPLQLALTGFVTNVGGGFISIGDSITDLKTQMDTDLPALTTVMTTEASAMTLLIDNLRAAVDLLKLAFADMEGAARNALAVINGDPDGNGGLDGGRADGGPVLSGGTYLVGERGPEIVTMGGSGYVLPNEVLSGLGGGQSYYEANQTTVNIYETSDVQKILYEMRRQGVRI